MAFDSRWDDDTHRLVMEAVAWCVDTGQMADNALEALADAGLLLLPGGVTKTEYAVEFEGIYHRVGGDQHAQKHSTHQRYSTVWPDVERPNDDWARHTTAWVEKVIP